MHSLHRRHGQDKTVLSCLVSAVWTKLATRQDSFVLSRPSFPVCNCSVSNILRTTENYWKLSCLVARGEYRNRRWRRMSEDVVPSFSSPTPIPPPFPSSPYPSPFPSLSLPLLFSFHSFILSLPPLRLGGLGSA